MKPFLKKRSANMGRAAAVAAIAALAILVADQAVKRLFLNGFEWQSACLSLTLTFNRGVAFSMLAFLGPWLKWLQLPLLAGVLFFTIKEGFFTKNPFPVGVLIGAGLSNVLDRFLHGGVVDYVAWHCGFEFAVFNLADVAIDVAVVWLLAAHYLRSRRQKRSDASRSD